MLIFFSKFRLRMLSEKKSGKSSSRVAMYLLYAIGEIILVAIGILIALQINNWNEQRKEDIKERKLLIDLVENLEFNVAALDSIAFNFASDDRSSNHIIALIENKLDYHDSLDFHFARAFNAKPLIPLSYVGYESLKNTGFDIIRNDAVKKAVINLFEVTYRQK